MSQALYWTILERAAIRTAHHENHHQLWLVGFFTSPAEMRAFDVPAT
jgi:hypothetical protein